jgi:hypothetical protein
MLDDVTKKMDATKAKADKMAADAKGKVEDIKAQI